MISKDNIYNHGKIYKIINNINEKIYIGSTTQQLSKRFYCHKSDAKNEYKQNSPIYKAMNELGHEKFQIVLIELYSCSSKEELFARETYYIKEHNTIKNGYNLLYSKRSQKEYYEDNKEKIIEYKKKWNEEHKDILKLKKKNYREEHK